MSLYDTSIKFKSGTTLSDVLEYADATCANCPNTDGDVCDMCVVRLAVTAAYEQLNSTDKED